MDSLLNKVLIKSFVAQDLYCCTVKVAIKSLEMQAQLISLNYISKGYLRAIIYSRN